MIPMRYLVTVKWLCAVVVLGNVGGGPLVTYACAQRGNRFNAYDARQLAACVGKSYVGSVLGVDARITMLAGAQTDVHVDLRGVPLGGRLRGTARIDEQTGAVVLDEALDRALRFRRCTIDSVHPSSDYESITVKLRLPFFGRRTLVAFAREYF